jgi:hypothetical protein
MDTRVVLRQFSYRGEAEIVRELLEANGIDAFVVSDDCGAVDPALQFGRGTNLLVAEGDLARADRLLRDSIAEAALDEDEP